MSILANHVPSIEPLHPGVLEVIESGNISKKWFDKILKLNYVVSGSFTNIHPGNHLMINNVVVNAQLKFLLLEAICANLQEALRATSGDHWSEDLKLEAQIEADIYEALQHALSSK
ncbi:hypothetical protein HD554DRAFT_2036462 [Boletus coccyginus]|nr:hypothetical protein HD554DRAFT_2036462 [Boletus coccyginus]